VREVWFFNGYDPTSDRQQVYNAYAANTKLMAVLLEASTRQVLFIEAPVEVFTNLRCGLTREAPWLLGRGRFLVAKKLMR
jgi:hypothetical protein